MFRKQAKKPPDPIITSEAQTDSTINSLHSIPLALPSGIHWIQKQNSHIMVDLTLM